MAYSVCSSQGPGNTGAPETLGKQRTPTLTPCGSGVAVPTLCGGRPSNPGPPIRALGPGVLPGGLGERVTPRAAPEDTDYKEAGF